MNRPLPAARQARPAPSAVPAELPASQELLTRILGVTAAGLAGLRSRRPAAGEEHRHPGGPATVTMEGTEDG